MKNNNPLKNKMKSKSIYKYTLKDKYNIKRGNIFWKWVDFLSYNLDGCAKLYEKHIIKEYKREFRTFNLSQSQNILHIGCGAYPITAISLTKENGCKVTGVDVNPKAVKRAENIVHWKKLDNRIKIKQGDGTNFQIDSFDTIIISSCSIPKIKILKHLFENAKKDTKIVIREQFGPHKLIKDVIDLYDNIELLDKIISNPTPGAVWESYFLIKR